LGFGPIEEVALPAFQIVSGERTFGRFTVHPATDKGDSAASGFKLLGVDEMR
jgi:hypothetical protein